MQMKNITQHIQTSGMRSDYTKGNHPTSIRQNHKNSLDDSR